MKNVIKPTKTNTDVERALVPALLNEQIGDQMHSTPSEEDYKNNDSDVDVVATNASSKIKG